MELGNESLEKERNSETEVREEGRELVEHMSVPSQHLEWSEGGTGTRGAFNQNTPTPLTPREAGSHLSTQKRSHSTE